MRRCRRCDMKYTKGVIFASSSIQLGNSVAAKLGVRGAALSAHTGAITRVSDSAPGFYAHIPVDDAVAALFAELQAGGRPAGVTDAESAAIICAHEVLPGAEDIRTHLLAHGYEIGMSPA